MELNKSAPRCQEKKAAALFGKPKCVKDAQRRTAAVTYKGYEGVVKFDEEAHIFHGEVINTRDVITFQGSSVEELERAFKDSVDDYLEFCASRNEEPEKPFSGNLMLRVGPELHKKMALAASREGKSLNAYVVEKLTKKRATSASS